MPSKAIPGRPDPDQIYRRFSARDWWRFFDDISGGAVLHQPDAQECPFCHAVDGLRVTTATRLGPPSFLCENCDRQGDVLDFTRRISGVCHGASSDALDFLARWAIANELPEVAPKCAEQTQWTDKGRAAALGASPTASKCSTSSTSLTRKARRT